MSSLDQILKILRGSAPSEAEELTQTVIMQSLAGEMNLANSITSRITNKLVSDVIDEIFSIKRRHKVTHV